MIRLASIASHGALRCVVLAGVLGVWGVSHATVISVARSWSAGAEGGTPVGDSSTQLLGAWSGTDASYGPYSEAGASHYSFVRDDPENSYVTFSLSAAAFFRNGGTGEAHADARIVVEFTVAQTYGPQYVRGLNPVSGILNIDRISPTSEHVFDNYSHPDRPYFTLTPGTYRLEAFSGAIQPGGGTGPIETTVWIPSPCTAASIALFLACSGRPRRR